MSPPPLNSYVEVGDRVLKEELMKDNWGYEDGLSSTMFGTFIRSDEDTDTQGKDNMMASREDSHLQAKGRHHHNRSMQLIYTFQKGCWSGMVRPPDDDNASPWSDGWQQRGNENWEQLHQHFFVHETHVRTDEIIYQLITSLFASENPWRSNYLG